MKILLILVILMQLFILIGICRTNNKLNELDATVSRLNDLIVPSIGANMTYIRHILENEPTSSKKEHKKKHKKKKDKIYADNMIIKSEMKGAKFL